MKKLTLSIASIAIMAVSAQAGKNVIPASVPPIPVITPPLGLYIGGGFTYAKGKCQCNNNVLFSDGSRSKIHSGKSYGLNLKAGYYIIDQYLALEGKYIYNNWGDKNKGIKHYGLYLKPTYPINDHIDIYALLGYGKTECESLKGKQSGFAWGAGAEYTINKKIAGRKDGLGVYIEYIRPLKKTGNKNITVDMVNIGGTYNF